MLTNYMIFYGNNLCSLLNTDSEHLYILREPPLAAFTQLKPSPFLIKRTWISKNKCVKSIFVFRIFLARE